MDRKELDTKLHSIKAEYPKGKRPHITDWGTIDESNFLDLLELKVGARVIMTHNKDVSDGLVNGVTGKARWRNFIFMLFPDFNDWECNCKIFQVIFLLMALEILLVFFL